MTATSALRNFGASANQMAMCFCDTVWAFGATLADMYVRETTRGGVLRQHEEG